MTDKTVGVPQPRLMRLPNNSHYPNYSETHPEDDWCAKVGCTPACVSVPTESRPTEPMQDIRGEVGFIAEKFGLSADATNAIYSMFCGQAQRWESKVHACEDRIRNQREEIKKLAASSSLLPVPEPEVQRDNNRCAICAWPLIEGDGLNPLGCVRGNCSLRPHPEKFYDFDRAVKEYGATFDTKYRVASLPVGESTK